MVAPSFLLPCHHFHKRWLADTNGNSACSLCSFMVFRTPVPSLSVEVSSASTAKWCLLGCSAPHLLSRGHRRVSLASQLGLADLPRAAGTLELCARGTEKLHLLGGRRGCGGALICANLLCACSRPVSPRHTQVQR